LQSTYNVLFSCFFRLGCSDKYTYQNNEISTNSGDLELAILDQTSKTACLCKFKLKKTVQIAMDQMKEKNFRLRFHGFKILYVAINITEKRKAEVLVEECKE
jgi:hypothetical protein